MSAVQAVADYRRWVVGASIAREPPQQAPPSINEIIEELQGRNLACWCAIGEPCHADVLLQLANDTIAAGEVGGDSATRRI